MSTWLKEKLSAESKGSSVNIFSSTCELSNRIMKPHLLRFSQTANNDYSDFSSNTNGTELLHST